MATAGVEGLSEMLLEESCSQNS